VQPRQRQLGMEFHASARTAATRSPPESPLCDHQVLPKHSWRPSSYSPPLPVTARLRPRDQTRLALTARWAPPADKNLRTRTLSGLSPTQSDAGESPSAGHVPGIPRRQSRHCTLSRILRGRQRCASCASGMLEIRPTAFVRLCGVRWWVSSSTGVSTCRHCL
jgi:hypothetical protein